MTKEVADIVDGKVEVEGKNAYGRVKNALHWMAVQVCCYFNLINVTDIK